MTFFTAVLFALVSGNVLAAVKTYQVSGPVLEVKDDSLVVQKGKEKWEIQKDTATKISGDVKVGEKVSIEYKMTATTIEAKAAKTEKKK